MATVTATFGAELRDRIGQVKRLIRLVEASTSLAQLVSGGLMIMLISCLVDNIVHLPRPLMVLASLIWYGFIIWNLTSRVAPHLLQHYSDSWVAVQIEKGFPQLHNEIVNAVQLSGPAANGPPVLVDAVLAESKRATENLDFKQSLDGGPAFRQGYLAFGFICALILYGLLLPLQFTNAASRLLQPWADIPPLTATMLKVQPGDVKLDAGEPAAIELWTWGEIPATATIRYREEGNRWRSDQMKQLESGRFGYTFPALYRSTRYRIYAGDARSRTYHLWVRRFPEVTKITLRYHYPKSSHLPDRVVGESNGDIQGPKGTQVEIEMTADKRLARAMLRIDGQKSQSMRIRRKTRAIGQLTITRSGSYTIELTDRDGNQIQQPPLHLITMTTNQPPLVEIVEPGRDVSAGCRATMILGLRASDDGELVRMALIYQVGKGAKRIAASWKLLPGQKSASQVHRWALARTGGKPGQVITYHAEASDSELTASSPCFTIKLLAGGASQQSGFSRQVNQIKAAIQKWQTSSTRGSQQDTKRMADTRQKMEKALDQLRKIASAQEDLLAATKTTLPPEKVKPTKEDLKKWEALMEQQARIGEMLRDFDQAIRTLPRQDFDQTTFLKEAEEVYQEIERSADALELKDHILAVTKEEVGLEGMGNLEELLEDGIAKLPTTPDKTKWVLEEPDEVGEMPVGLLPDELEDLIGDLIDQQEDINELTEDVTSAWATADISASEEVRGGPISNMSAKGKTGNELPDSNILRGRSGEGRTGKSEGELVEATMTGKDDRKMPPRMSSQQLQKGDVKQLRPLPPGQATGGGKRTGWGPEGERGPIPPELQEQMQRLANLQVQVRRRTEQIQLELRSIAFTSVALDEQIALMKDIERELRSYQPWKLQGKQQSLQAKLKKAYRVFGQEVRVQYEVPAKLSQRLLKGIWNPNQESYPPEYQDLLKSYYKALSQAAGR